MKYVKQDRDQVIIFPASLLNVAQVQSVEAQLPQAINIMSISPIVRKEEDVNDGKEDNQSDGGSDDDDGVDYTEGDTGEGDEDDEDEDEED